MLAAARSNQCQKQYRSPNSSPTCLRTAAITEADCAVVGQPWLSDYSTVYPRVSEYKTCYPIPGGGGEEYIETPLGGGIRAYKPKVATAFDAAGCPLS